MSDSYPPASGTRGQMLARLLIALQQLRRGHPDSFEMALLGLSIALNAPGHMPPDPDKDLPLLAARLQAICEFGVDEAFIVTAAREHVSQILKDQADGIATANENRSRMRQEWQHVSERPDEWRAAMALNPETQEQATWTDEQVRDHLLELAAKPIFDPVDADSAALHWAAAERWASIADDVLPNTVLAEWASRNRWLSTNPGRP